MNEESQTETSLINRYIIVVNFRTSCLTSNDTQCYLKNVNASPKVTS